MASKRALERQLADLQGFAEPRVELEQYATPAQLAAHLLHLADLQGDFDRPVVDLGTGTGILAIGAILRGAPRVVGIDSDRSALLTAKENEDRVGAAGAVDWLQADATELPLAMADVTVVMNPPFGAQREHRHADRDFLETAAGIAKVSYSIHNADSHDFVAAFTADYGGTVTHAFEAELSIERQFPFHDHDRSELTVEVYRIEWV